ncbi:MAG: HAD-IA family hydrolase [Bdellovibrionota bacterium]|nr:HAD-IA family hydrolase [Bdellovibrionota bacterium]
MKILNCNLDNYDAIFFDLDGTLINSMPLHNQAWIDTFKENNVEVPLQFFFETAGMSSLRIVEIINERHGLQLNPEEVSRVKRDKYLIHLNQVEVVEKVIEIVKEYYGKRPLGIITGGSHEVVDQLLPKLGIDKYFDTVICSDDTKTGKDGKEPYMLATKNLNVSPEKSLFLDDGDVGLKGALSTGMDVIHVDVEDKKVFMGFKKARD